MGADRRLNKYYRELTTQIIAHFNVEVSIDAITRSPRVSYNPVPNVALRKGEKFGEINI